MSALFVVWIGISAAILWHAKVKQTYTVGGRLEEAGPGPALTGKISPKAHLPPSGESVPVAVSVDGENLVKSTIAFRPDGSFRIALPPSKTACTTRFLQRGVLEEFEISFRAGRLLQAALKANPNFQVK